VASRLVNLRRVVITGIGCLSPIGIGREAFWKSLKDGRSGTGPITRFDASDLPVRIAAEVKDFDPDSIIPSKDRQHVSIAVAYALAAADLTFSDAGISLENLDLEGRRGIGIVLGSGGASLTFLEKQFRFYFTNEARRGSVYTVPTATPGSLPSEISMALGLRGFSHLVSTGCTSSTDAISYAAQMIALGRIDTVLSGGVDAPFAHSVMLGFCVMKVLTSSWNDEPLRASRPFSRDRDGFVLGEGAYFLMLEERQKALARGARIYGEIAGYGSTCDAYHRVRLDESGIEPARAMKMALEDARLQASDIDYVNLHGTSTQLNDRIETRAIKLALGENSAKIPMSATKSMIGHPQGASGAAGVIAALAAISEDFLPPTINLDEPDPECDLDYVANKSREHIVNAVLCNCIGFGSKNSALVITRSERD
jgi:3-oxoacyl-[acyl-carrier-protein] synthase II